MPRLGKMIKGGMDYGTAGNGDGKQSGSGAGGGAGVGSRTVVCCASALSVEGAGGMELGTDCHVSLSAHSDGASGSEKSVMVDGSALGGRDFTPLLNDGPLCAEGYMRLALEQERQMALQRETTMPKPHGHEQRVGKVTGPIHPARMGDPGAEIFSKIVTATNMAGCSLHAKVSVGYERISGDVIAIDEGSASIHLRRTPDSLRLGDPVSFEAVTHDDEITGVQHWPLPTSHSRKTLADAQAEEDAELFGFDVSALSHSRCSPRVMSQMTSTHQHGLTHDVISFTVQAPI